MTEGADVEERLAHYEWHFAYHFGIAPYDLGRLTAEQFDRGCAAIDHINASGGE